MTDSDELPHTVAELFHRACELDPEARAAFVKEVGAADPALRAELESLLAHDDAGESADVPIPIAGLSDDAPEPDPDRVGPYRILESLGEGGMGVVYLAEQEAPVRRRVAVKLIKWGMDTKQVVARFEMERQALALMDHPNIARVFDAGSTDRGRPYFVMEFVQGQAITEYCDEHRLGTDERLELFVRVCEGVHHAHRRGIIHRDIKPSNVLVTVRSNRPVPKVIDFGVAKSIAQQEGARFTQVGALIGTPAYISPEQTETREPDIDTRTDVYSLGVLLYELLVGVLPFEGDDLRDASSEQVRRRIREAEFSKPSRRLSGASGASTDTAERRSTDPRALKKRVSGDLDWITMRALAKERERRYSSAVELAADIERHLKRQPVLAGPPGAAYRLQKFVQRHRAGVVFAAVLLLVLITAAAALGLQAQRVRRERDVALQLLAALEQLLQEHSTLVTGDPRRAVDVLRTRIAELRDQVAESPEVEVRLLEQVADLYEDLELYGDEIAARREVLDQHAQLGVDDRRSADDMQALAAALVRADRALEAGPLLDRALQLRVRLLGEDHPDVAATLHQQALERWKLDDFARAGALFRQAQESRTQEYLEPNPAIVESARDYGRFLQATADYTGAEELLRKAVEVAGRLQPADPGLVAAAEADLAMLLHETGRYGDAEPVLQAALASVRETHGPDHPRAADLLADLARVRGDRLDFRACNLGSEAGRRIFCSGPRGLAARALAMHVRVLDDGSPRAARSRLALAETTQSRNPIGDVVGLQTVLDTYADLYSEGSSRNAEPLTLLGRALALQGRHDEAEPLLQQALRIRKEHYPKGHWRTAESLGALGVLFMTEGRFDEAEPMLLESLAAIEVGRTPYHRSTRRALEHLVALYTATNEAGQAESYRQRLRVALDRRPVTFVDFDLRHDGAVLIDYDDDAAQKTVSIDAATLAQATSATLWILGKPANQVGFPFVQREDYFIRVNGDDSYEVAFDVGQAFNHMEETFQWVSFDVPIDWLRPGGNTFFISERGHGTSWTHNNLFVALDTDTDLDHSWWCGNDSSPCDQPSGSDATARDGELMISLELGVPEGTGQRRVGDSTARMDERLGMLLFNVASALEARALHAEGERLYRACLAAFRRVDRTLWIAKSESGLGGCLTGLGRYDEAEGHLLRSLQFLLRHGLPPMATGSASSRAVERLVRFSEAVGRTDEAARYRAMLDPTVEPSR